MLASRIVRLGARAIKSLRRGPLQPSKQLMCLCLHPGSIYLIQRDPFFHVFYGACLGSLACSTCHVIVTDVNYCNKLEDPTDEENDMLDLAFGFSETWEASLRNGIYAD